MQAASNAEELRLQTTRRRRGQVGFNATRRYRDDKRNDLWLLVVAAVVLGAGLLWGFGVI